MPLSKALNLNRTKADKRPATLVIHDYVFLTKCGILKSIFNSFSGFFTKSYGNIRASGSFCVVFKSHSVVQQCRSLPKGISVSFWSNKFIHTRRICAHAVSLVSQHCRQHEALLYSSILNWHLNIIRPDSRWYSGRLALHQKRFPQVFPVESPESRENIDSGKCTINFYLVRHRADHTPHSNPSFLISAII